MSALEDAPLHSAAHTDWLSMKKITSLPLKASGKVKNVAALASSSKGIIWVSRLPRLFKMALGVLASAAAHGKGPDQI